ncbi:MAG: hypothetical protein JMN24_14305 [gamma proteobacterium endosymbiont of Lamellibrachia anaximandri]|nr:hypothetical protein [gamma proteobacterium endosymbiont of Lamellibrachia anaximandri]MBL3618648.1 hypothetical protein [gamma proteobacterium endosymbiont of Lamellibrachia anaximandri]
MPIAIKWSIAIGTLISLVMGTLGWFLITQQNSIHMREVEIFGTALVEQLSHSSSEPLLADDLFNLQGLVSRQTQSRNIVGAAIIGLRGLRADSGVVPQKLDDTDKQNSSVWVWRDEDGVSHPVITFTTPIRFRDTTAGQAIITLDREFLDRHQRATIRIIAYATLGLILIAALLSYALSHRLSRPITLLAQAGEKKSAPTLPKVSMRGAGTRLARSTPTSIVCPWDCWRKFRLKRPSPATSHRWWQRRFSPIWLNPVCQTSRWMALCSFATLSVLQNFRRICLLTRSQPC